MKTIIVSILTVVLASSALALNRPQLDDRIQSLTAKFTAMEQNPATRVPAGELARAKGIILLDRTKGALILGVHGGNGVALTREPAGQWSSVGFVSSGGASLGPQIGGSKDFFVILLMSAIGS
jgi:lipid-binding SYLF domain-containing protein